MGGTRPPLIRQPSSAQSVEAEFLRDKARARHVREKRKQHIAENPYTEINEKRRRDKIRLAHETLHFMRNVKTDSFGFSVDAITSKVPKFKTMPPEEWQDWKGSPSTVKTLSFSRTSNVRIHNEQEWRKIMSNAEAEQWQRSMKKKKAKSITKLMRGMTMTADMIAASENRKDWENPSSAGKHMVFSNAVKYHPAWRNPYELPDADIMHEEWLQKNLSSSELIRERKAAEEDKVRRLIPNASERSTSWEIEYRGTGRRSKAVSRRRRKSRQTVANDIPWNFDTNTGDPEVSINYQEPKTAYRMKRVPPKNISGRVLEKLEEERFEADSVAKLEKG